MVLTPCLEIEMKYQQLRGDISTQFGALEEALNNKKTSMLETVDTLFQTKLDSLTKCKERLNVENPHFQGKLATANSLLSSTCTSFSATLDFVMKAEEVGASIMCINHGTRARNKVKKTLPGLYEETNLILNTETTLEAITNMKMNSYQTFEADISIFQYLGVFGKHFRFKYAFIVVR